jgi:hypothetical protein
VVQQLTNRLLELQSGNRNKAREYKQQGKDRYDGEPEVIEGAGQKVDHERTYQMGASTNLMIQKQTAKLNIAAAIVKPTWSCMRAS